MSISRFFLGFPSLGFAPSDRCDRGTPINRSTLSALTRASIVKGVDQRLFPWNTLRTPRGTHGVCRAVPGTPPPSFDLLKWVVGVAVTLLLPVIGGRWRSLLRLKDEIETVVETTEAIVHTVEKVAEGVEKVAEDIAEELPEGSKLRESLDLVEHVAERASRDARLVDEFIDKVQEVEVKVEAYVESTITAEEKSPPTATPEVQGVEVKIEAYVESTVTAEEKSAPPPVTTNDDNTQEISP